MTGASRVPLRRTPALHAVGRASVACALLASALVATNREVSAQALRIEGVDAATGSPLRAALVVVVDGAGRVAATAALPASGIRTVAVPGDVVYRVHVRRIGFDPFVSTPVSVGATDTVAVRVVVRSHPVVLTPVESRGRAACGRLDAPRAAATLALWDQLRTALALTDAARDDADAPAPVVTRYVTRFAADGDSAVRHTVTPASPGRMRPFASYAPETLSRAGYVRDPDDRDGAPEFAVPDERVLLDDAFVRDHCFRRVVGTGDDAGLVGVAFEPVPGRDVADIAGVVWADPGTGALRYLVFEYVDRRLPANARGAERAGGEAVFDTLADGRWIVRAWRVRMPVLHRQGRRDRSEAGLPSLVRLGPTLTGVVETGAVADLARVDGDGAWARRLGRYGRAVAPASLRLVTYDSLAGRPLPGARVWLRQVRDSVATLFEADDPRAADAAPRRASGAVVDTIAATDASAVLALDGLPAGTYEVRWSHDELLAAQIEPAPRTLAIAAGAHVVDTAATPAFATVWRACGRVPAGRIGFAEGGVATGVVRDERTSAPVGDAIVTVAWAPIRGIPQSSAAVRTASDGTYAVCGVPVGVELSVVVTADGRASDAVPIVIGERRVVERELWTSRGASAP